MRNAWAFFTRPCPVVFEEHHANITDMLLCKMLSNLRQSANTLSKIRQQLTELVEGKRWTNVSNCHPSRRFQVIICIPLCIFHSNIPLCSVKPMLDCFLGHNPRRTLGPTLATCISHTHAVLMRECHSRRQQQCCICRADAGSSISPAMLAQTGTS